MPPFKKHYQNSRVTLFILTYLYESSSHDIGIMETFILSCHWTFGVFKIRETYILSVATQLAIKSPLFSAPPRLGEI